jgi:hypothetical protein
MDLFDPSISTQRKVYSSPLANNDAPLDAKVQSIIPELERVLAIPVFEFPCIVGILN